MDKQLKSWNEIADAALIPNGGSAQNYKTGSWKTSLPEIDLKKCVHCLLCWWYCPDSSIRIQDAKVTGIDLDHCKGCGLCAVVCPEKVKAIQMRRSDLSPTSPEISSETNFHGCGG